MLKLTIKPGECLAIGEDVKVVITGGTQNNYHVMVDAPRSMNIVRGKVLEKNATEEERKKMKKYYTDTPLTGEDVRRLIAAQKRASGK